MSVIDAVVIGSLKEHSHLQAGRHWRTSRTVATKFGYFLVSGTKRPGILCMKRFHQFLFAVSLVALSWFLMMAVHELGHVVGAIVTGGSIERVVLYPLSISRTDVSPNPHPAIVVWLGPVVGSLLPLAMFTIVPQRQSVLGNVAAFFAGFCLIANGAYIAIGSFDRVGDCGEMLRTGTPLWAMLAFGAATVPLGLYLWHGLGSLQHFIENPTVVTPRMAYVASGALIVLVAVECVLSPQ